MDYINMRCKHSINTYKAKEKGDDLQFIHISVSSEALEARNPSFIYPPLTHAIPSRQQPTGFGHTAIGHLPFKLHLGAPPSSLKDSAI